MNLITFRVNKTQRKIVDELIHKYNVNISEFLKTQLEILYLSKRKMK